MESEEEVESKWERVMAEDDVNEACLSLAHEDGLRCH